MVGLFYRNGRYVVNRRLGYRVGGGFFYFFWFDERRKFGVVVGLLVRSSFDGRLSRY